MRCDYNNSVVSQSCPRKVVLRNITLNLPDLSMVVICKEGFSGDGHSCSGRIIIGFTFPCTKRTNGRSPTNVKYVDEMLKML